MAEWIEEREDAVMLRIRVQPRASRTESAGRYGTALRIRVAAPPVDGAANAALIRFIARAVRVPRNAVRVVTGESGRNKVVEVKGASVATIIAALVG